MLYNHDLFFFNFNLINSCFSILILNILIYLISTISIFLIFFFFNLDNFISLNKIKIFSSSYFFYMSIILLLLSMLGMPPMAGFCGKFLMTIFMNLQSNFFFFFFF